MKQKKPNTNTIPLVPSAGGEGQGGGGAGQGGGGPVALPGQAPGQAPHLPQDRLCRSVLRLFLCFINDIEITTVK